MVKKRKKGLVAGDLDSLYKQWGEKVVKGEIFSDDDLASISTGSIKLDWALGRPLLEGSMVEVYGPQSVGKTTLALTICSNAMNMGKYVFYIDLERKLREAQINMINGFNRDKFTVLYPDTGEEAMDMMYDLIINFPGCLIILDSVGGLLPEVEDAEGFEKQSMGLVARLCHKMIRKLTGINARNKCTILFINHLTATMSLYSKGTTHGGKAIKNRASQRIELFAPSSLSIEDENGEKIGHRVKATIVKNNVFRPGITVTFPIVYGRGIDQELDIFEFARDLGIISQSGGWCKIDGDSSSYRGKDILSKLKTDEKFKEDIVNKIKQVID